jgi:hypothetical protein
LFGFEAKVDLVEDMVDGVEAKVELVSALL